MLFLEKWLHNSSWRGLFLGFFVAVLLGLALAMSSELTRPIFFG